MVGSLDNFGKGLFEHILVWVKFPGLSQYLQKVKCLSKRASFIGKPIMIDQMIATNQRLIFAESMLKLLLIALFHLGSLF